MSPEKETNRVDDECENQKKLSNSATAEKIADFFREEELRSAGEFRACPEGAGSGAGDDEG